MKKIRGLALGLAAGVLLSGCGAGGGDSGPSPFAPEERDRLVVYTSHKEEVWWPIVREFEERTGIWVDVVTGGTNELLSRIAQEAEAPAADVMEVVRCKDCIWRGREECAMFYRCDCGEQHTWETDNDFCSYGERRD